MTAMLGCDGCGTIVQDRGNDEAKKWMELNFAPTIGGSFLPDVTFNLDQDFEEEDEDDVIDEPSRHFCSVKCLQDWTHRAQEQEINND